MARPFPPPPRPPPARSFPAPIATGHGDRPFALGRAGVLGAVFGLDDEELGFRKHLVVEERESGAPLCPGDRRHAVAGRSFVVRGAPA